MSHRYPVSLAAALLVSVTPVLRGQSHPDSVIQRIWSQGMDHSQLYPLARTLLDSIGPRVTGSSSQRAANEWALAQYRAWNISARAEPYGTWLSWRRGITHVDLLAPRAKELEGSIMTFSPGTKGPVSGPVVVRPAAKSAADFDTWLAGVRGKFVLGWFGEPTCRPDEDWSTFGRPETVAAFEATRRASRDTFYATRRQNAPGGEELLTRLRDAGALGFIGGALQPGRWVEGWGVEKLGSASGILPEIALGCEDYALLYRLVEANQAPVVRVNSEAAFEGDVPVANVVAELPGTRADQYVLLSAHLDSWDAASGATDNGANTVVIMEAMRILKQVLPHPKRTILAGHWNGEEQGLNGSGAFAADHADVMNGVQAVFNADDGTGRVTRISMEGFTGAGALVRDWLARAPQSIAKDIQVGDPGTVEGGSDELSFVCRSIPAFGLQGVPWNYETYTWHTNRDTFDKLVFDDLKEKATLIAMLAYMASEDDREVPRDRYMGRAPGCPAPARDWAHRRR